MRCLPLALALLSAAAPVAGYAQNGSVIRIVRKPKGAPKPETEAARTGTEPTAPASSAPILTPARKAAGEPPRVPSASPPPSAPALPPPIAAAQKAEVLAPRTTPALPTPRLRPGYVPTTASGDAQPAQDFPVVPVVTIGVGLVLGVVGAILAGEAASALDQQNLELEIDGNEGELTDEFRDTQGRVVNYTIASTAVFSAAASATVIGLVLLFEDLDL